MFYKVYIIFLIDDEEFRAPRESNFTRRGRGRRGGYDMDRRGRGLVSKRRIGILMKNKRSEDEEKICQYFLQGKCLKVKSIKINE